MAAEIGQPLTNLHEASETHPTHAVPKSRFKTR